MKGNLHCSPQQSKHKVTSADRSMMLAAQETGEAPASATDSLQDVWSLFLGAII